MSKGILSMIGAFVKGIIKLIGCKGRLCERIIKRDDDTVGLYSIVGFIVFGLSVDFLIKLFH